MHVLGGGWAERTRSASPAAIRGRGRKIRSVRSRETARCLLGIHRPASDQARLLPRESARGHTAAEIAFTVVHMSASRASATLPKREEAKRVRVAKGGRHFRRRARDGLPKGDVSLGSEPGSTNARGHDPMASDAAGSRRSNRARSSPRPPAVTPATKRSAGGCASAAATGPLSEAALAIPTRPRPSELKRAKAGDASHRTHEGSFPPPAAANIARAVHNLIQCVLVAAQVSC